MKKLALALAVSAGCAGSTPPPAESPTPAASAAPAPAPSAAPANKRAPRELEGARKKARDGDLAGATADARKAIADAPGDADAYLLLASLQGMQDDAKGARKTLEDGLAAAPRAWALHHALGMSALESGEIARAVEALEEARKLLGKEPNGEVAADLAYAYLFAKRLDEAEKLAREAIAIDARSFPAQFTLGEALLRAGRFKDAVSAYRAASDIQPDDPLPRGRLATSLMKSQDFAGAAQVLEKLVAAKAEPGLYAALAQCYLETSRPKDAVLAAEKALAGAPDQGAFRELLATAQEAAGDKAGAKKTRTGGRKK